MKATPVKTSFMVWFCLMACMLGLEPVVGQTDEAGDVDFAKEVQPLLARRCFACHGPDDAEGGLRLDNPSAAVAQLDSGDFAIVPHQPEKSVLLERIASHEEGVRMPPEGRPLTAEEQAILRRWIANGARWKKHWAFEPIVKPTVPAGSTSENPVDAFIDQKLRAAGLCRSEPASPASLLRRLYFDLIGLPPTPAQVADFLAAAEKDFDQAYEREIDKLLASAHYGERWARHWLDVVRYAETNSFERDGVKPHAWRYRDYVIRSFNEDKPYDQFVREQIAGDELSEVTKDSLVATGFYRLGVWDDEPADRELAKYDAFDDILTTVGQGLLGLTVNCSRCHDHKIDPLPASDYYSLLSFFRNLTPNGYGPHVERPLIASQSDRERLALASKQIKKEADDLQSHLLTVEKSLRDQIAELTSSQTTSYDLDNLQYRFYRDTFNQLPNFDELKAEDSGKVEPPLFNIALTTRPDYFGFVFTGSLIVPEDGVYQFSLDSDDGSRLIIDGNVILEYDGIHGEGSPRQKSVPLKKGRRDIRVDYFQGVFGKGLTIWWSGEKFRRRYLTPRDTHDGKDLREALNSPIAKDLNPETVAEYRRVKREIEENSRKKPWDDYGMCVSEHGTQAPETFVLLRGSPEATGDKVEPRFPEILGGQIAEYQPNPSANTSGRRLALANWLTSPDNRLTSRVIVNRIWQHHFGRGIVRSANNFGQLGDLPTHPEMLDWLAVQLVENGWKLKPLHKLMLLSQTYRQGSIASEEAILKDPSNDLFSHFNLRRLSAEEIRDSILATNGRLNPAMYGPSIYPEISREVLAGQSVPGKGWNKSNEEDQARRSVYIHIKRSLVVPLLANFDFPETDVSCEARFNTTQAGQALAMLNGDFLDKESQAFAGHLRNTVGTDLHRQIDLAYQLALSRKPTAIEIERGQDFIASLKEKHELSDDQALKYFCLFVFNLNEFIYID